MANILVVEDNLVTQNVLKKMIEAMGHEVYTSNDGLEAYNALDANYMEFDLLITDYHMPKMNGEELVQSIVLEQLANELPIIVISGMLTDTIRKNFRTLGVNILYSKPVNKKNIQQMIQCLVG